MKLKSQEWKFIWLVFVVEGVVILGRIWEDVLGIAIVVGDGGWIWMGIGG